MDILITGASGYLGARLYFDLSKSFKVLGTYNTRQLSEEFEKLDITDSKEVFDVIKSYRPDLIVHCAAKYGSKKCESDPMGAIQTNEKGTENLVTAANHFGCTVAYISTIGTYSKENFYTKTKHSGETQLSKARAGHIVIRPSFLFGMSPNTNADNIFNKMLNDIKNKHVSEYDNTFRFQPTWIGSISEVIAAIKDKNIKNAEIDIFSSEMKSKFEMANDILSKFGVNPKPSREAEFRESKEYVIKGLDELEIPVISYGQICQKIISEIKERNIYTI
jgi:dTDP-4-dehydrorhamnose reductase